MKKKLKIDKKEYKDAKQNLFNAIRLYSKTFIILAETMAQVKNKYGRKTIEEVTNFDVSRINSICGIGNLPLELCNNLLPETLAELQGMSISDIETYANQIRKENLKASQVRKLIRANNKTIVVKDKKTKVNNFGKHLLLLENELKGMDASTKARALAHLTNTITTI